MRLFIGVDYILSSSIYHDTATMQTIVRGSTFSTDCLRDAPMSPHMQCVLPITSSQRAKFHSKIARQSRKN